MTSDANTSGPYETIEVETAHVSCDGGGTLGHPKVYLEMGAEAEVRCPYCDRLFALKTS